MLRAGRPWVKLTGPYRISNGPPPHADTHPFAQALVEAAPDRLVWGSDWPHVKTEWTIPMPNDGDLADLLAIWVADNGIRERVLAANPARLYGFA
jgi:predicted TIM-barrel fold metal-dependent hydrolase